MTLTESRCRSIFDLAGIPVLDLEALIDGYGYSPDDPRYVLTRPRCVWWFVQTPWGWIKIGWRKHVIAISWNHTKVRVKVTTDSVTVEGYLVHADNDLKAIEYLQAWKSFTEDTKIPKIYGNNP